MKKKRFKKKDVCILRGGSWNYGDADIFRAHVRYWYDHDDRFGSQGFRCVFLKTSKASKRLGLIENDQN